MANKLNRLTAATLANPAKLGEGRNSDGGNLYLVKKSPDDALRKSVTLYWTFMYRWRGKQCEVALGPLHAVPAKTARQRAKEGREMLHEIPPRSPAEVWRAARRASQLPRADAFAQMWRDHVEMLHGAWSAKHRAEWTRSFALVKPLHDKPCAAITTVDMQQVLTPIWMRAPETASRTRGRVEAIWDRAKALDLIPQGMLNPARWKGHLDQIFSKASKQRKRARDGAMVQRGHHPALPYADVPAFAAKLRAMTSVSARALEFALLTAARSGEVLGMELSEIDFAAETWKQPLERMKTGKNKGVNPHVVPLSGRCIEILAEMKKLGGPWVFPGRSAGSRCNVNALSDLMEVVAPGYTVHGLRSTFRDFVGDKTTFPREIAEFALAHAVKGVEGDYRRSRAFERRRKLMNLWSDYCMGAVTSRLIPARTTRPAYLRTNRTLTASPRRN
jgi:integrase